jgi:hypothetical protein
LEYALGFDVPGNVLKKRGMLAVVVPSAGD